MSDIKELPANLSELEKGVEFKRTYKKNTVDELELQLIEENVEFLSADNKAELVWRLLDAQGYKFEATDNAEAKEGAKQDQGRDTANGNSSDASISDTVNADDSSGGDSDTSDAIEPVTPTDKGDSNEATENANADTAYTPAQEENANDNDNASGQGDGANDAKTDSTSQGDSSSAQKINDETAALEELEFVEVENNGGFDMLEPATGTLVKAGGVTKVYIKEYATKEQVLRNIAQYNQTRGKKLAVTN